MASRRQKPLDFSFWIQRDEKHSSPHADTSPLIHLLLAQGRKIIGVHVRPPWSQDGQFLKYEGMNGPAGWGRRSPGKTGQLVWTGLGPILGPGPYGWHPGLKQWNDQGWLCRTLFGCPANMLRWLQLMQTDRWAGLPPPVCSGWVKMRRGWRAVDQQTHGSITKLIRNS